MAELVRCQEKVVACPDCCGTGEGEFSSGPDPVHEPCALCYGQGYIPLRAVLLKCCKDLLEIALKQTPEETEADVCERAMWAIKQAEGGGK